MNIEQLVEAALEDGHLTPEMQAEVQRLSEVISNLSVEEYEALDRNGTKLRNTASLKIRLYLHFSHLNKCT